MSSFEETDPKLKITDVKPNDFSPWVVQKARNPFERRIKRRKLK